MIIFEISPGEMETLIFGKECGSFRYFRCGQRVGIIFDGMGFLVHGSRPN